MKGPLYYIVVYDVEQKRVSKCLKILRKYLHWVQNSVFEGELSDGQFFALQRELFQVLDKEKDSVIFYKMREKWMARQVWGVEKGKTDTFI